MKIKKKKNRIFFLNFDNDQDLQIFYKSPVELGNRFNPNTHIPTSKFRRKKKFTNLNLNSDVNLYSHNWFKGLFFDLDWNLQSYRYNLYWRLCNDLALLDSSLSNFLTEYYKQDYFSIQQAKVNAFSNDLILKLFGEIKNNDVASDKFWNFVWFVSHYYMHFNLLSFSNNLFSKITERQDNFFIDQVFSFDNISSLEFKRIWLANFRKKCIQKDYFFNYDVNINSTQDIKNKNFSFLPFDDINFDIMLWSKGNFFDHLFVLNERNDLLNHRELSKFF